MPTFPEPEYTREEWKERKRQQQERQKHRPPDPPPAPVRHPERATERYWDAQKRMANWKLFKKVSEVIFVIIAFYIVWKLGLLRALAGWDPDILWDYLTKLFGW